MLVCDNENKQRVLWIDSLKGLCIIFVVLGHAVLGFWENQTYPASGEILHLVKEWIYTWHMPVFFVLSGITFRISQLKGTTLNKNKLRRSVLNLLIIYLIFETALPLLKIVFSAFVNNAVQPSQLIRMILLPTTPMWYIWVLMIYYVIFAPLHYATGVEHDKRRLAMLMGVLAAISLIENSLWQTNILSIVCFRNLLRCGLFFAAGIYFRQIKAILMSQYMIIVSAIVASSSCAYMIITTFVKPFRSVWINSVIILGLNPVAICVLLIALFIRVRRIGENRQLIFLGKNSLIVYLLHTYFVTAMRVLVVKLHIGVPVVGILAATVIPLVICCVAALIIPHIPIVRGFFSPIAAIDRIKEKKIQ